MEQPNIHRETFNIRASEVDPTGKVRLQSLCELLQETAGNHALKLNFDISQLQKENLTWVLHRLHIRMDRYPGWRDTISIKTWPSSGDTLRAFRDFLLLDEEGKTIGRALSYWIMLNTNTRRPVRIPQQILEMAPRNITHVLEVKNSRLSFPSGTETSKSFSVRRSDLDMNHHVNNAKYVEWAVEMLPDGHSIDELDIEFHAECKYGDYVISELSKKESSHEFTHRIKSKQDEKVLVLAQSRFTSV